MNATSDTSEIARLVPMPRLLAEAGFPVNDRTRRGACPLHGGKNPTAFAWREDGRWHCFSCGAGGDRIALVRGVRRCSFPEAVKFLSELSGVKVHSRRVSRRELARRRRQYDRTEQAAWRIADEVGRLRRYYTDALHRTERLQKHIGAELLKVTEEAKRDYSWERLAHLAPVCTFFFAGWNFIWDAKPEVLARFALASSAERRRFILEGFAS